MRCTVLLFTLIATFIYQVVQGQNHFHQGGIFPELAISYRVSGKWKLTGKVESQHGVLSYQKDVVSETRYFHDRTDLQLFGEYRLSPFLSVSGGYQYRLEGEGGTNNHRLIQQISIVRKKRAYRLGHRIRTDQTFEEGSAFQFRFRYRLSFEVPLQGTKLDPGEWYLLASGEPIIAIDDTPLEIENRLVLSFGRMINTRQKIETGFDYRIDRFIKDAGRSRWWWKTGWFVSF